MKRRLRFTIALLLLAVAAAITADRFLKSRGHPGLRTFVQQWAVNYPASFAIEPTILEIEVDEADLEALRSVVEGARERGVIMPEGNDYVDASFDHDGHSFKGRVRIKGKLSDHVQGSKWSFRVIASKGGAFLGMQRFSLQHPGTRNYLNDWFYHRISAGEGIIALRYGFCKVVFNGDDLGVYAFEEYFGEELVENSVRLRGPLLRFDPGLFWIHRLNAMEGRRYEEAFAGYQAAAVDAYGTSALRSDTGMMAAFEEAVQLIDRFRRAEVPASAVFDVDRMARRHAIIDLIGGHHSMDWSDVKFHFDPVAHRLEPVAYESFSAFPTKELAGAWRYSGAAREQDDLHDQLFKDPALFRAYIHHLERLSRKEYLDSTFAALKGPLDSASATVYREFPYKELDRGIYYRNQEAIRRMLDVPQVFHAYRGPLRSGVLEVLAVPIENLPMEVMALVLPSGERIVPKGDPIVPCRPYGGVGKPHALQFPLPGGMDTLVQGTCSLEARVLGASVVKSTPLLDHAFLSGVPDIPVLSDPEHARSLPFLVFDDSARIVRFRPGAWTLNKELVIPAGYVLEAYSPLRVDLVSEARITVQGRVKFMGTAGMPVIFTSTDTTGHAITVMDGKGVSLFSGVEIPSLRLYRSNATVEQSDIGRMEVLLARVTVTDCRLSGGRDLLRAEHGQLTVHRCTLSGATDDGAVIRGGSARFTDVLIENCQGTAIKASLDADVQVTQGTLRRAALGIEANDGARVRFSGPIVEVLLGVKVGKATLVHGVPRVDLMNVELIDVGEDWRIGTGGELNRDGDHLLGSKAKKGT